MNVVGTAAILVAFPVVATVTGAVIATLRTPGPAVSSGIQHFAAGVVFAALAGELLPELRREGHLLIVVGAFTAGVVLLLALGAYSRRVEATRPIGVPAGLLAAVGVDLLVDGLLVGLGVTLGKSQGVILTIALTLEVLFLGLSVSAALAKRGAGRVRAAMIPSALGLATAAGAIGGAAAPAVGSWPLCWPSVLLPCCTWSPKSFWWRLTNTPRPRGRPPCSSSGSSGCTPSPGCSAYWQAPGHQRQWHWRACLCPVPW